MIDSNKINPSQPMNLSDIGRDEFSILYAAHAPQLYTYIRALVSNQADAEDAFQDTSAVLWQKFSQYRRGTNFAAWATSVAKFCVLNLRDYQRRGGFRLNNELMETIAGEATALIDGLEAQHRALAECYSRLSAVDRDLIDRRYRTGVSIKDLAEQLGRPLRTVYRLFERIHITLLNCVEQRLGKQEVL